DSAIAVACCFAVRAPSRSYASWWKRLPAMRLEPSPSIWPASSVRHCGCSHLKLAHAHPFDGVIGALTQNQAGPSPGGLYVLTQIGPVDGVPDLLGTGDGIGLA